MDWIVDWTMLWTETWTEINNEDVGARGATVDLTRLIELDSSQSNVLYEKMEMIHTFFIMFDRNSR